MDGMDELKQIFFTECAELLADMEARLMKLDEGTQDKEELNAIFRCAHSIKGGSGAFGFDAIMQFTHTTEAVLDLMREGKLSATREIIDLLLKAADIVTKMLDIAQSGVNPTADLGADVKAALHAMTNGSAPMMQPALTQVATVSSTENIYTIVFLPHEELFTSGNEPLLILRELEKLGKMDVSADITRVPALGEYNPTSCTLGWTIRLQTTASEQTISEIFEFVSDISDIRITKEEVAPAVEVAQAKKDEPAKSAATPIATSIRVDLEKLDRLVNMVGELVITEAMLRSQVRNIPIDQHSGIMRGIDELSHHTRELQEAVMAVRMQPVKSVFSRMPRIVRDTASQLGKEIQLVMMGGMVFQMFILFGTGRLS